MQRYNILTSVIHDVVTPYLRFVFRCEWDTLYPHMPWDDSTISLNNFKQQESKNSLKTPSGKDILKTSGHCDEWDFTILCFALLFSDFGQKLKIANPSQYDATDTLRKERNKLSHSRPNTYMKKRNFNKRYEDILQCLQSIGCKNAKADMEDIVQQIQGNQDVGICLDTGEQCEIQGLRCCPKIRITFKQFLITFTMLGLFVLGALYGVQLYHGPTLITTNYPLHEPNVAHDPNVLHSSQTSHATEDNDNTRSLPIRFTSNLSTPFSGLLHISEFDFDFDWFLPPPDNISSGKIFDGNLHDNTCPYMNYTCNMLNQHFCVINC